MQAVGVACCFFSFNRTRCSTSITPTLIYSPTNSRPALWKILSPRLFHGSIRAWCQIEASYLCWWVWNFQNSKFSCSTPRSWKVQVPDYFRLVQDNCDSLKNSNSTQKAPIDSYLVPNESWSFLLATVKLWNLYVQYFESYAMKCTGTCSN